MDLAALKKFIKSLNKNGVTRIVLVPSFLRILLANPMLCKEQLNKLNLWISSGASLKKSDVEHFYELLQRGDVRLLNIYGSTEVTADATYYDTYETYNGYKAFELFKKSAGSKIDSLIYTEEIFEDE